MAWSAIYNREPGIIETTYIGQMSREELQEAITATVELITANRVYLLFGDAMKLEHDGSIFDIYEMVSVFEQFPFAHYMKEALLIPVSKAALADLAFYETACKNRGLNVRLFNDKDDAIRWLCEK